MFFCLYESSDLSLEQVNKMYGTPGLKPWRSEKWLPEGFSSRSSEMEDAKYTARRFAEHQENAGNATADTIPPRTSDDTMHDTGANPALATKEKPVAQQV